MRRNQRDSRLGFSRPVPRVGQPGSGVTPAKNPCGWHGEDQETMRRDCRSEAFVLDLSHSYPAGVICGRREKERSQESLCHDNYAGTRHGMRATLTIRRCAKMTIREWDSRFAHTDAAFPRNSSRRSRRSSHDSGWPLFGHHAACELCTGAVDAPEIME